MLPRRTALFFSLVLLVACQDTTRPVPAATSSPESPAGHDAIAKLVRDFGSKLQLVSLLAPRELVAQSMRQHYAPFVAPALLQQWIENPPSAPGRRVSSPWPDRIEIRSVKPDGPDRYGVDGEVVEMTSAGEADRTAVRLVVERIDGAWRITDYGARDEDRTTQSVTGLQFTAERQGDGFLLTLENRSADRVGYNLCVSTLERRSGEQWEEFLPSPICTMELRSLGPGQRATFPRQIEESLPAGKYRFVTGVEVAGSHRRIASDTVTNP
jgi:hypothetical protein